MAEQNIKIGSTKFHLTNVLCLTLIAGFFTFSLLFVYYLTYVPENPLKDVEALLGETQSQYIIEQQNTHITDLDVLPIRKRSDLVTYFKTSEIPTFLIKDKDSSELLMKAYLLSSGGFGGAVKSLILTDGEKIIAHEVLDAATETAGLGQRVTETQFKAQFVNKTRDELPNDRTDWMPKSMDMISGATFSSTAVVNNLKKALNLYPVQSLKKGGQNG
ncbi:MAG: FMN-binding protein [Brevinema sp.]